MMTETLTTYMTAWTNGTAGSSMMNLVTFSFSRRIRVLLLTCFVCAVFLIVWHSSEHEYVLKQHTAITASVSDRSHGGGISVGLLGWHGSRTESQSLPQYAPKEDQSKLAAPEVPSAKEPLGMANHTDKTSANLSQREKTESNGMLKELYSKVELMNQLLVNLRQKNDELQEKLLAKPGAASRNTSGPNVPRPNDVVLDTLRIYSKGVANLSYLTTAFWRRPNPHNFNFLIGEPHFCQSNNLSVVITVLSSLGNRERRDKIRKKWGRLTKYKNVTTRAVFLLGRSENATLMKRIREESYAHEDIIQEDFVDSYENLTMKSVMALKWTIDHCSGVRYMFKLDDDVTDNFTLTKLFMKLEEQERSNISLVSSSLRPDPVLCNDIKTPTPPIREPLSKWHASREQYPDQWYPRYCNGCDGYLVSVPVAQTLYDTSLKTRYFIMEDAYITGILPLIAGNITLKQLTYF